MFQSSTAKHQRSVIYAETVQHGVITKEPEIPKSETFQVDKTVGEDETLPTFKESDSEKTSRRNFYLIANNITDDQLGDLSKIKKDDEKIASTRQSSGEKSESEKLDTLRSGESLIKYFNFNTSKYNGDTDKCVAFWKALRQTGLKPAKCTLIKSGSTSSRIEEPNSNNNEDNCMWYKALVELQRRKMDEAAFAATSQQCKLCDQGEAYSKFKKQQGQKYSESELRDYEDIKLLNNWKSSQKLIKTVNVATEVQNPKSLQGLPIVKQELVLRQSDGDQEVTEPSKPSCPLNGSSCLPNESSLIPKEPSFPRNTSLVVPNQPSLLTNNPSLISNKDCEEESDDCAICECGRKACECNLCECNLCDSSTVNNGSGIINLPFPESQEQNVKNTQNVIYEENINEKSGENELQRLTRESLKQNVVLQSLEKDNLHAADEEKRSSADDRKTTGHPVLESNKPSYQLLGKLYLPNEPSLISNRDFEEESHNSTLCICGRKACECNQCESSTVDNASGMACLPFSDSQEQQVKNTQNVIHEENDKKTMEDLELPRDNQLQTAVVEKASKDSIEAEAIAEELLPNKNTPKEILQKCNICKSDLTCWNDKIAMSKQFIEDERFFQLKQDKSCETESEDKNQIPETTPDIFCIICGHGNCNCNGPQQEPRKYFKFFDPTLFIHVGKEKPDPKVFSNNMNIGEISRQIFEKSVIAEDICTTKEKSLTNTTSKKSRPPMKLFITPEQRAKEIKQQKPLKFELDKYGIPHLVQHTGDRLGPKLNSSDDSLSTENSREFKN